MKNGVFSFNAVGLLGVRPVGGEPAQRSAEAARSQAEDLVLVVHIAAAGIEGLIP
jgi:hypothetical protein